ncbi:MAG: aconitate hydratase 1 [Deltaproteobacteria bacterium GWC2_65_14]|nr:MAG: aconitate hydratase 1 [Deltaproteobacteria bacterium GWC2_65_14]
MGKTAGGSFGAKTRKTIGGKPYEIFSLPALERRGVGKVSRLPRSIKVLLENLLRHEDGVSVTAEDIESVARWSPKAASGKEIAFRPARILLQDFTGVPALVDLAAMRDAAKEMGADPKKINPLMPADLVIDHSVQVDRFGSTGSFLANVGREMERNGERYAFLRWGKESFRNFRVVPPGTGICHQVNLEYLAPVVFRKKVGRVTQAFPDTLVGTDSHTPMINGLGVVGWGVGGIEAEAAMLGQPLSMLTPQVVGFKLSGSLPPGATATDLVLTVTQMLRAKGVVGKFVEFYGKGLSSLSLPDRATISNMSPEYGATIGFFPVDRETLSYLLFTGRSREQVRVVEAYCKAQGLFRTDDSPDPVFSDTLSLDLSTVQASLAGPKRPQDRVPLAEAKASFREVLAGLGKEPAPPAPENHGRWHAEGGCTPEGASLPAENAGEPGGVPVTHAGTSFTLHDGSVVIAAITSCTNTSNPAVMIGAGLLAKKAVERGLRSKPWVKTSLAPGSKVVTRYLDRAGLTPYLEGLGFHLVGYGCTTCIGNSGPLPKPIEEGIRKGNLFVASVLSGNRNFEGRIHPMSRANYLASPPLVVAYALAGRMDVDLYNEPVGLDPNGEPVFLKELWPSPREIEETVRASVGADMFRKEYAQVFEGDEEWKSLPVPKSETFAWDPDSTYVKHPPFFEGLSPSPEPLKDLSGLRVLAILGDSVTTDHISPAGDIAEESPAGKYLREHGIEKRDFNSYGSRRGNHEVMMRGTFANIRLRNLLVPGTEGGWTARLPDGETTTIYDAAMQYASEGVPLMILAGKEYGSGSSRDWAAKGPRLLGVQAVLAESFERIHRSNLVGMGILPLQFEPGETRETLGLSGKELFAVEGIAGGIAPRKKLTVRVTGNGAEKRFTAVARIDTPEEVHYYGHGGILQYVLRRLAGAR